MNIQIFGKAKCFDTKKAQRYFKDRGIRVQEIDILKKGLSRGELDSVLRAVGGLEALVDTKSGDYDRSFIGYLADYEAKLEKLTEYPGLYKTPVVRNGREATIGYCPEVWALWK